MINIKEDLVTSSQNTDHPISRAFLGVACHNPNRRMPLFLPAFLRMFDLNSQTVVFERQPEERLVRFDDRVYQIQLPWMLYVASLRDLNNFQVYCSNAQLNDTNDELMIPPLPNVSSLGHFCVAKAQTMSGHKMQMSTVKLLRNRLSYLMNLVWDSKFTIEYPLSFQNLPNFVPQNIRGELMDIEDITKQWHRWLELWEEHIDLLTAMRWDTNNKIVFKDIIAQQTQIPENESVAETIIFDFLNTFSRSLD